MNSFALSPQVPPSPNLPASGEEGLGGEGQIQMTNDETRMTKEAPMTNDLLTSRTGTAPSSFAHRHSFVIRHSSFVIFLFACLSGTFAPRAHGQPATGESSAFRVPRSEFRATTNAPRWLEETELLTLLTETLQRDYIKTRGELELRLTRPWTPIRVPSSASPVPRSEFRAPSSADPELTLKILELPNAGVTASCIIRIALYLSPNPENAEDPNASPVPSSEFPAPRSEFRAPRSASPVPRSALPIPRSEKLGEWQLPLQAHIWREVWVARAPLKRGDNLADAEIERERRDLINNREPLADFAERDPAYELAEPLQNHSLLLARTVRLRPVIRRGQLADALVEDGALRVVMKVEALEDGAPGQVIRARNPQTRRDLRGKVLNEQTIALSL